MGFDDFFEQEHKHHRHGNDHNYRYSNDDYHHSPNSYDRNSDIKYQLLNKLKSSPKLRALLLVAAILIVLIIITIAILLIPLIMKLFNMVGQNGIQGLIDTIWKGTK